MDLRECFVRGAGKADFTSQTAEVTLTNIQCNLLDSKVITTKFLKILMVVMGWKWYGTKGRLILKRVKLLLKALPLAFMQTTMEIMTNKSQQTTDRNGVINLKWNWAAFGEMQVEQSLIKLEINGLNMDGLNPKVNLRPGRQL